MENILENTKRRDRYPKFQNKYETLQNKNW